jgi:DNA polymerase III epsilon subunit-like protein
MPSHWTDTPIHVIDFEGSRASGVLEYGAVTIFRGGIVSTRTRLCAPLGAIPPEETRIHGIDADDTRGMAPFAAEQDFFMDLRLTGPLCAHNASFEKHLLKALWPYPRSSPDFLNPGRNVADWGPWIDTLRLYELVFPMLTEHGLGALLDAFGLKEQLEIIADDRCPSGRRRYHCALYDALGSAMLLTHLGRLPGYEDLPLEWLLIHSQPADDEAGQQELF